MVDVLVVILVLAVSLGMSWAVTVGLIKLVTICFGWPFSLLTATGIWLILLLARSIFKSRSRNE